MRYNQISHQYGITKYLAPHSFAHMIRVAIIEDIESIRRTIAAFLRAQENFEIVSASGSVEEFLEVKENITQPDVILCDIGLPGISGLEGIKIFKREIPHAEVVMLTVFDHEEHIYKALCAGATGYLLKSSELQDIKQSIVNITLGEVPMSKAVARKVLDHFNPKRTYAASNELTAKEKQVLQSMADGLSYKMIAERLSISLQTVQSHVKNIYRKLHVHSKAEAIRFAIK